MATNEICSRDSIVKNSSPLEHSRALWHNSLASIVALSEPGILIRSVHRPSRGIALQGFFYFGRIAGRKAIGRNLAIFANHTARRHQRAGSNNGAAEKNGAHSNEAALFDACPVKYSAVTYGDVFFQNKAGLRAFAVSDDIVLYVASAADTYGREVSAQDRAEPDAGIVSDFNIADDGCVRCDEGARRPIGP